MAISPKADLIWQVKIYFPPARDQQWKSCTSSTVLSLTMSLYNYSVSISLGVASIIILTQSLKIGTVVKRTSTEKMYVQIGSAFYHSGPVLNFRIREAEMTPILWTISPRIWINAALIFIFCSTPPFDLFES